VKKASPGITSKAGTLAALSAWKPLSAVLPAT
jgi:hypothetical protein